MAEAPHITDEQSFETWLKSHDEETTEAYAKVLAGRVALLVLPNLHEMWYGKHPIAIKIDLTVQSWRCHIISGVARKYPTPEMKQAARSAAASALSAARSAFSAGSALSAGSAGSADSARSAASALSAASARSAALSAAVSALSAASAADIWASVQADAMALHGGMAAEALEKRPLWQEGTPEWFAKAYTHFQRALNDNGPHWAFWLEWYAAKLDGQPMAGLGSAGEDFIGKKLAEQKNDFWKAGAEAIGTAIDGWVGEYKLQLALKNLQSRIDQDEVKTWLVTADTISLNAKVAERDAEVLDDAIALQRYEGIQRRVDEFTPIVAQIVEIHGWDDLASHFQRIQCLVVKPLNEVIFELGRLYDASLDFAAFLDQDNDLRQTGPQGNKTQLDAHRRRKLETLIIALGPWLRMFPSLRAADDEAGQYFQRLNERQNAIRVAEAARNTTAISQIDHELLHDLLTALDRLSGEIDSQSAHLTQKAAHRGTSKVKSLITIGMMGLASFISGGAASIASEDSILMNKLAQAYLNAEFAIIELYQNEPPDLRNAVHIMLERLNKEREKNPTLPIHEFRLIPVKNEDDSE